MMTREIVNRHICILLVCFLYSLGQVSADDQGLCDPELNHIWTKNIRSLSSNEYVSELKLYKYSNNYLVNVDVYSESETLDTSWIKTELILINKNGENLWSNKFTNYKYGEGEFESKRLFTIGNTIYRFFRITDNRYKGKKGYYLISIDKNGKIKKIYFTQKTFIKRPKLSRSQFVIDQYGSSHIYYTDCKQGKCRIDKLQTPIIGMEGNNWKSVYKFSTSKKINMSYIVTMIDRNTFILTGILKKNGKRIYQSSLIKFIGNRQVWRREIRNKYGTYVVGPYKNNQYLFFELPIESRKGDNWKEYYYEYAFLSVISPSGSLIKREKVDIPPQFSKRYARLFLGTIFNDGIFIVGDSVSGNRRSLIITGKGKIHFNERMRNWYAGLDNNYIFQKHYTGTLSKCLYK